MVLKTIFNISEKWIHFWSTLVLLTSPQSYKAQVSHYVWHAINIGQIPVALNSHDLKITSLYILQVPNICKWLQKTYQLKSLSPQTCHRINIGKCSFSQRPRNIWLQPKSTLVICWNIPKQSIPPWILAQGRNTLWLEASCLKMIMAVKAGAKWVAYRKLAFALMWV